MVEQALTLNLRSTLDRSVPYEQRGKLYYDYPTMAAIERWIANAEGWLLMAGKAQKRNTTNFAQTTFVQFKLSKEQKAEFQAWFEDKKRDISSEVARFMSEGNKTSLTWDAENGCWIVSSTCKDEGSPNLNHCLTSRAAEWYEGLAMNAFKALVLLEGTTWSDYANDDNLG